MTILKNGEYVPLSPDELKNFVDNNPEIYEYMLDPSKIDTSSVPKFQDACPIFESWDKAAKRLIN